MSGTQHPGGPPSYGPGGGGFSGGPIPSGTVKNYLVESILCLLCCAGLLAIPAIIYASQVDSKLARGDYQGAVEASRLAKTWCTVCFCIGLAIGLCNVAVVFVYFLLIVASAAGA